jgi:LysR family glycine cleavage system transcriptional activator
LRALVSFARHESVWRAADELHLTRSAVSHQLRLLERDLGFKVLERVGRGVKLTLRGQRYAHEVHKALIAVSGAAAQLADRKIGGSFSISCAPGFASFWLCKEIASFQEMYPDVALRIVTPRRLDDVDLPGADVFIAYGDGNWSNRAAELICLIGFMPLCSPSLLNRLGGLSKPADVLRANLLHLEDVQNWSRWFSLTKVNNPDPNTGIIFSDMNLVMSAAIAGQGIAMGDTLTGREALREGRLVRPFDIVVRSPRAYYLVSEHDGAHSPILGVFATWLKARLTETSLGVTNEVDQVNQFQQ